MSTKQYYICTAIPYVNDKPHIGHAMDFVYADILARYNRQLGNTVVFGTGTDEHGGKISEKAAEVGLKPKEFTDGIVQKWQSFIKLANISNDRFIRTTDKAHETTAALIWKSLAEDIYKKSYVGWYCVGCEEFYTETQVKEFGGTCPHHNRAFDKIEEENYFFKLSKYSAEIRIAIESDELLIVPQSRKNEILNVIRAGLEDISVSRPSSKISWGIPVPGDTTQTMYVWFDALMNYITTLGYPNHPDFTTFWPADVQVIGKDILRFHAAIWPAMLMSLKQPLPKKLYVHGHVTSNGKKMSKTLGNIVDPVTIIEEYGADALRYYLARHIPSHDDGDFSAERFEIVYNNELANELGNAVSRVASMAVKYMDGVVGDIPDGEHDQGPYHEALAECRFDKAMEVVWDQVRGLNQYIDTAKPWAVAKEGDATHLREILAYCISCLGEIAELLTPFMPDTSNTIRAVFTEGIVRFDGTSLFPKKNAD